MRVALVCLEKGGGISHCAFELAKAMSGLADVTCFLSARNNMQGAFASLPCTVRTFPLQHGPRSLLAGMILGREPSGMRQAIEAAAPDLILDAGSGAWGGVVFGQVDRRIPIAQIVHDVDPHPDIRSYLDALPGRLRPVHPAAVIGMSSYSYDRLSRRYPASVRITSRHGVIMQPEHIQPGAVGQRRHKQLFIGRIHPYKGLATLVEAFAIGRELDPTLNLDIVGSGYLSKALMQRIERLGIGFIHRHVSDAEFGAIVSAHGVLIAPYTSATQSGVAAIALAHGLPCIATSVGGLPEQVINNDNGIIVPPGNVEELARAMVAISTNAHLAERMSTAALRLARDRFAWPGIAAALVAELAQFLGHRRPRPPG